MSTDFKKTLRGCRNLDRRSQRKMVDRLTPYLYSICRRYSNQNEDAKDILQDALVKIFNGIDRCKANDENGFLAWSAKITVNVALSKYRKEHRQVLRSIDDSPDQGMSPEILSNLNTQDILRLLDFIPENHRCVFNLVAIDGYKHQEVAELMNIKESSSRAFLSKARKRLQELIEKSQRNSHVRKSV